MLPTSTSKLYFFFQRNLVSRSNKKLLADCTDWVFTYERRNWSAYQRAEIFYFAFEMHFHSFDNTRIRLWFQTDRSLLSILKLMFHCSVILFSMAFGRFHIDTFRIWLIVSQRFTRINFGIHGKWDPVD